MERSITDEFEFEDMFDTYLTIQQKIGLMVSVEKCFERMQENEEVKFIKSYRYFFCKLKKQKKQHKLTYKINKGNKMKIEMNENTKKVIYGLTPDMVEDVEKYETLEQYEKRFLNLMKKQDESLKQNRDSVFEKNNFYCAGFFNAITKHLYIRKHDIEEFKDDIEKAKNLYNLNNINVVLM